MRFRTAISVAIVAAALHSSAHAQNVPPPPPPPPLGGGGGGGTTQPTQPTQPTNPTTPYYPNNPYYPGAPTQVRPYPVVPGQGGQGYPPGYAPGQPGGPVTGYPGQPGFYPPNQGQRGNYPPQQQQPQPSQTPPPQQAEPATPPPPPDHIIEVLDADHTLYALPGDVIRLKGHFSDNGHPLDHSFLELDRARSATDTDVHAEQIFDSAGGFVHVRPVEMATSDDYQYDWKALVGDHYLRVGYVTSQRAKRYAQYAHVVVLDKSPFVSDPSVLTSVTDLPVKLTLVHDTVMLAKKIDVYLDDKPVGTSIQGPPFTFTLPIAKADPGNHPLRIVAYDDKGNRYEQLDPTGVVVAKRVALETPASFTVAKEGDTITVTPKLGAGFKPTRVEYYLKPATGDDILVGKADKDPFDTKLDLGAVTSGQYSLHAVSYVGDEKFDSDMYPIALTNSFGEAAAAKAAQEAAQKKAQEAEANAEKNAATDLHDHPKLTWSQVNQKVSDTIANFLAARPSGSGGKRWAMSSIKHIRQPDQTQNVYLAAVIVNSPEMTGIHAVYSVDLDKGTVTDLQKTW